MALERSSKLRLSPAFTFVGLGVTAALGAVTVWSAVDTFERRDRHREAPTSGSDDARKRAARRTWIFASFTGLVAIGTVLLAILGTDWGTEHHAVLPWVDFQAAGLAWIGGF